MHTHCRLAVLHYYITQYTHSIAHNSSSSSSSSSSTNSSAESGTSETVESETAKDETVDAVTDTSSTTATGAAAGGTATAITASTNATAGAAAVSDGSTVIGSVKVVYSMVLKINSTTTIATTLAATSVSKAQQQELFEFVLPVAVQLRSGHGLPVASSSLHCSTALHKVSTSILFFFEHHAL
jgi:hypothetical protein